ncbi:MAG: hypothetical protein GY906_12205 [bacterium]|nr:hypothetical protein [bacterium]
MFWFALAIWAIATVAYELIRPKPKFENARPSALGDFQFPTATEGRALPIVWGKVKIKGPNCIWYGNFRKFPKKENVKTGLFSSEDVIVGYYYYVGMQFGLCHGEVDSLGRIWINEKHVKTGAGSINQPNLYGGEETGTGGVVGTLSFYPGSDSQAVNAYLTTYQSPQPAYRGTCYCVFEGGGRPLTITVGPFTFQLPVHGTGYVGMTANIPPWAFEVTRIPDGLNMASADPGAENPNTYDCNPMNVLYEILTDTDWGIGIDSSLIDTTNFQAAASTLATEGNGWSMLLDNPREAVDLIAEIQRQVDGSLFFNRTTGQWQVKLVRDDYTVGSLDIYDETNIVEVKEYVRQTWEETTNQVRVAFVDRDDEYKDTFALAQDPANMALQGSSVQSNVNYPAIKNGTLANSLAWRDLKALSYPLAKIKIGVNRQAWGLIPGDVFKFSWDRLGISEVVFRVHQINYGKVGSSQIEIYAIQDIFAAATGVFSDPIGSGWEDPEEDPVAPLAADSLIFEAPRQLVTQDTFNPTLFPRWWTGARDPEGGTVYLLSYDRSGPTQPVGGSYDVDTVIAGFVAVGTLDGDLDPYGTTAARPNTTHSIDVDEVDFLDGITVDATATVIRELTSIAWIGDDETSGEWIGFEKAEDIGGDQWRLSRLWRGLFNTPPKAHLSGEKIWFISQGGNLTRRVMPGSHDEMDIQLRGVNGVNVETTEGATPELEIQTRQELHLCPLAPRDPVFNGTYNPTTEDFDTQYTSETGRTGDDARAMEIEITPRDWLVDNVDQDDTLRSAALYLADSPEFDFTLTLDPAGTPVAVGPYNINTTVTPTAYVLRNDVIIAVGDNAVIPTTANLTVVALHQPDATQYTNPFDMEFLLDVTSALQGADDLTHGGVGSTASPAVVYGETGNYTIDIHTALPSSGIVEININTGGWVTLIGIGVSSNTVAITATDSVQLRWQTSGPAADQFFDVTGPTAELGYGVLLA